MHTKVWWEIVSKKATDIVQLKYRTLHVHNNTPVSQTRRDSASRTPVPSQNLLCLSAHIFLYHLPSSPHTRDSAFLVQFFVHTFPLVKNIIALTYVVLKITWPSVCKCKQVKVKMMMSIELLSTSIGKGHIRRSRPKEESLDIQTRKLSGRAGSPWD